MLEDVQHCRPGSWELAVLWCRQFEVISLPEQDLQGILSRIQNASALGSFWCHPHSDRRVRVASIDCVGTGSDSEQSRSSTLQQIFVSFGFAWGGFLDL